MRYSAQIRAARGLLGWSQNQLARRAGVGPATLQRIEQSDGIVKGNFSTIGADFAGILTKDNRYVRLTATTIQRFI